MGKNDCNIIRDLMPLVIDRVASDESREAVEEHIATCGECRKQYDAMKAALPDETRTEYEKEQKKIVDALKAMRKLRLKRRIISIALAVVICAVAAFGGMFAYNRLYIQYSVAVDNSLYALSLAQLEDGRLVVTADAFGINFDTSSASEEYQKDGKLIVYIYFAAAPIHTASNSPRGMTKGPINILTTDPNQMIEEIRQGKPDNYVTVWSAGDSIPTASQEMETYFTLEEQMAAWFLAQPSSEDGKVPLERDYYVWQDRLEAARIAVPEWQ